MSDEPLDGAVEAAPEAAPAPEASNDDYMERAFRSAGLLDDEQPASEEGGEDGPARGPDGRFARKEAEDEAGAEAKPEKAEAEKAPAEAKPSDAPARFSPDAKAEWDKTPAPVKAEISRAFKELEGGIEQYRQRMEPLRQYQEMAEKSGTTLHEAMGRYVAMEQQLRQDPLRGLDLIARNAGMQNGLQDVIAHVTGQKPEQAQAQQQNYIAQLQQEISQLKEQVGGVSSTIQQQQQRATMQQIEAFASQHDRFEELSDTIAQLLNAGMAEGLEDAYEKASRLNPAAVAPPPAPPAQPDPAAQTRKASLSVQGAPGSGSNPASRQRSATTDEAVQRAFAQLGIS